MRRASASDINSLANKISSISQDTLPYLTVLKASVTHSQFWLRFIKIRPDVTSQYIVESG